MATKEFNYLKVWTIRPYYLSRIQQKLVSVADYWIYGSSIEEIQRKVDIVDPDSIHVEIWYQKRLVSVRKNGNWGKPDDPVRVDQT